jgi:hypothetical protein
VENVSLPAQRTLSPLGGSEMKRFLVIQIAALLLVSGGLGGMLFATNVYSEVQNRIVMVLCLSCLKLEPTTEASFTFTTANQEPHPPFLLENLTRGPIFLHYSEDVCHGCDIMYPVIKTLFSINFSKQDSVYDVIPFEGSQVSYFYINIDHTTSELRDTFYIYDKNHVQGLPMFTIITLGYDNGVVKPYYASVYGTLNKNTDAERLTFLRTLIQESIEIYDQNKEGYTYG